uniref:Uncharacterized protein n=1 Tax=Anguilla anguilla TaxID=7936 RepID=A0A0E9RCQ2_ANGAN
MSLLPIDFCVENQGDLTTRESLVSQFFVIINFIMYWSL